MEVGFSVQMVFIFIQTDDGGHGFNDRPPGLNVTVRPDGRLEQAA